MVSPTIYKIRGWLFDLTQIYGYEWVEPEVRHDGLLFECKQRRLWLRTRGENTAIVDTFIVNPFKVTDREILDYWRWLLEIA